MTLEDASKEKERLENDLNFYQNRLEKIKSLGIEDVVFDRCHHIFHGKVKALVDGVLSKIDK